MWAEAPRALEPGESLAGGRFTIRRRLGEGGMGVVYEAFDRDLDASVALKTIRTPQTDLLLWLKREFRSLEGFHHPSVVRPGELIEAEGRWFFSMELVDGTDLLAWIAGDRERLRPAFRQLAEALSALHGSGHAHRDVKPSNLIVTSSGRVVLLDFGLARELDRSSWLDQDVAGTAQYMAPEQARGEPPTAASDWYSFGLLLFEAAVGRPAFFGDRTSVLQAKRDGVAPTPAREVAAIAPELDRLIAGLLASPPEKRLTGDEVLAALGGNAPAEVVGGDEPFVGRVRELAGLDDAVARLLGGHAVSVVVHGASGVGKSALLQQLGRRLPEDVLLLSGRCRERESLPYKAIDGVVDALAEHLAGLPAAEVASLRPDDATLLARAFPVLSRVDGFRDPGEVTFEGVDRRRRLFVSFRELVRSLSARWPLAIVIDDIHWADADGLAMLEAVLEPPSPPPVLIVLAGRSRTTLTTGDSIEIEVTPLSPDESARLARELGGDVEMDVDRVVSESRGHPLFLAELVQQAARGSSPTQADLDDVLMARAQTLGRDLREVLELVAVAGAPTPQRVLGRALGMQPLALLDVVAQLAKGRWVRTHGPRTTDGVDSYHDRIRESVVARLDAGTRAARHRALAGAFEAVDPAAHEKLAIHWRGGGDRQRAYRHTLAAVEQAYDSMAFDHAAALLRVALDEAPGDAEPARIRERLADALAASSRPGEAAEQYLEVARDRGGALGRRARRRAVEQLLVGGRTQQGLELLDDVLADLDLARSADALTYVVDQRIDAVIDGAEPARPGVELRGLAREQLELLWSAGSSLHLIDAARARELQAQLVAMALDHGEPSFVVRAMALYTCAAANVGPLERAERLVRRCNELLATTSDPQAESIVKAAEAMLRFNAGDARGTRSRLLECMDLLRRRAPASSWDVGTASLWVAVADWTSGRFGDLRRHWEVERRDAAERQDEYYRVALDAVITPLIHLLDDDPGAAAAVLDGVGRELYSGGVGFIHSLRACNLTLASLYAGEPERAVAQLADPDLAASWRMASGRHYSRILAVFVRGTALLASPTFDRESTDSAIAQLDRDPIPWGRAFAAQLRGGLETRAGRADAARAAFRDAEVGFAAADLRPFELAARHALGRCLGGEAGAALTASVEAELAAETVANPERFARMLAPI